jgi:hypothetical protein
VKLYNPRIVTVRDEKGKAKLARTLNLSDARYIQNMTSLV